MAIPNESSISVQQFVAQPLTNTQPGYLSAKEISAIAPVSLAYIGDAVFELYVRSRLLLPAKRIRDYHQQVVAHVKAEQQAHYADILAPHLTETETDLLRRGRNATSGRHRRAAANHYQKSTGFEALIGFLYLSDRARLHYLLHQLDI
ncbi:MAG: ribonuclease III domain-containing protein [Phormidesmis sp.]